MLLTALFAVNIAAVDFSALLLSIEQTTNVALLVAVGLCIDVSKYLFWHYRKEHGLFLLLSIVLVGFSWAASVAFFTSQESDTILVKQTQTSDYIAHNVAIAALESQIAEKRKLLAKRLSSSYHSQWDQGQLLLEEINDLNKQLKEQIRLMDTVGIDDAQRQLSTAALFSTLSSLLSLSFSTVSNSAYAVLAFIIEACSLGVMSLVQRVSNPSGTAKQKVTPSSQVHQKRNRRKSMKRNAKIKRDIVSGSVQPHISKIIKNYSIGYKEAKKVMENLEEEGKLKRSGRLYHLVDD